MDYLCIQLYRKIKMNKNYSLFILIGIFAVAMGFLESAMVVYLRAIYYPQGFAFPLKALDLGIVRTEVLREAATMIMLCTIALIAVKQALTRFAVFIYTFAIWDICYYFFLYLLLRWPPDLLTWDILFLLPVTWVGPVLAPLINSFTMILLAVIIISSKIKNEHFKLTFSEWLLLFTGSAFFIFCYTQPFLQYFLAKYEFADILSMVRNKDLMEYSWRFIPINFNWVLFCFGELFILYSVLHILKHTNRT
jgi:hypothetical protein